MDGQWEFFIFFKMRFCQHLAYFAHKNVKSGPDLIFNKIGYCIDFILNSRCNCMDENWKFWMFCLGTRRRKVTERAARTPADSVGENPTPEKFKERTRDERKYHGEKNPRNLILDVVLVPLLSAREGSRTYFPDREYEEDRFPTQKQSSCFCKDSLVCIIFFATYRLFPYKPLYWRKNKILGTFVCVWKF